VTGWTKAAIALGIGLVLGIALRTILPSDRGLSFLFGGVFHVVPFDRIAFWLCVATAIVTAALLLARNAVSH
jgi:hypothetical protein